MIVLEIVVLLVVAIFVGMKIYHFIVIRNVYEAIENFRSESNRYYLATIKDRSLIKEEIIMKNDVVKWSEQKDGITKYCQWKNFTTNQKYSILLEDKTFKKNEKLIMENSILKNLPQMIFLIYSENGINIKELFKIKYILKSCYNGRDCYKIVANTKVLILDKDTYLPIHYSVESRKSDDNDKIITEITYQFKVGEVTDEDIALPDLTGYTEIMEE